MKHFSKLLIFFAGFSLLLSSCEDSHSYVPVISDVPCGVVVNQGAMGYMPIMKIYTAGSAPITSKSEYVRGGVQIIASGEHEVWALDSVGMQIRGRGNSTWGAEKKPYRIKLDKKRSLLGMKPSKNWVLLANWFDRTMLHTPIAFYLGQRSKLEWTPSGEFVELYLNDEYIGCYYLCEKIEVSEARLNLPSGAFLLEVDDPNRFDEDDVIFSTIRNTFVIKEPKVISGDDAWSWIRDYITIFDQTLYSPTWLDDTQGYANFVDKETFADWALINEILKNTDAVFFNSCYMYVTPGGAIKMGPLWDFDLSLGTTSNLAAFGPEGFWVNQGAWLGKMWLDPSISILLRERFDYFKTLMPALFEYIDSQAAYISDAVAHDETVWNTWKRDNGMYHYSSMYSSNSFCGEVYAIKEFLKKRIEWLDANLPQGETAAIHSVTTDPLSDTRERGSSSIVGYYNLQGQRITTPQRGQLVIVRYSDGTSRKMLVQ